MKGRRYALFVLKGRINMYCYVLFVKTGYEHRVADEIFYNWQIKDVSVFVPMHDASFKKAGKVFLEKRLSMPSYVFIESPMRGQEFYLSAMHSILRSEHSIKLLKNGHGYDDLCFEMAADEYDILEKLINKDSCIEMSQGVIEGTRVVVTNGPLSGFEGLIKRINRHKMEAIINIGFMGTVREMKVGLEIVKKML